MIYLLSFHVKNNVSKQNETIERNYLSWKVMDFPDFFKKKRRDSAGSIALVCIVLNDKSFLQLWSVVFFMFIHKIWMNSMGHICRHY